MRLTKTVLAMLLASPICLAAQTPPTMSQQGRSILAAGIGLTGTREASASPGQTTARATGQVASLAFTHFVSPSMAFEITGAILDADASAAYANNSAAAVTSLVFGMNYAPASLALSSTMRPYISAGVGPYVHSMSETSSSSGSARASTQSRAGARFGAGMNVFVARHFAMQLEGTYHLVDKFEPVNGVTKDPSGFGLSFGLAVVWGGK